MGIELINDKKKIVLYLNTILIISFIWVIFVNTSYFFEKTVLILETQIPNYML